MNEKTYSLRTISTDVLKIHGNCLEFKNTVIQLSNVSMFSAEVIEPDPFPFKSLMWIIAGIFAMIMSTDDYFDNGFIGLLGFCCGVIGVIMIANWYGENKDIGDKTSLIIITNSGDSFALVFNSSTFLNEVISKLREIISNPSSINDIVINISDNKFTEIRDNTFNDRSSAINNYSEIGE